MKTVSYLLIAALPVFAQKPPTDPAFKSDVVVQPGETGTTLRVGQVLEIRLASPPEAGKIVEGLKVEVLSDSLNAKPVIRDTRDFVDDNPVAGTGYKSIFIKAEKPGKTKVTARFRRGDKDEVQEFTIEVR